MNVKDLGTLSGEILLFGGVYGNLQALEALMAWADARSISNNARIHVGDIAAYCADPVACVAVLRARSIAAIKGNVEAQLAADQDLSLIHI